MSKELEFKKYKSVFNEIKNDGDFIGYDILGWDSGFHTYLCNGLDDDLKTKYILKINKWGLLDNSHDEVEQFAKFIDGEGEPVLWLPFAVYSHKI